MDAGVLHAADGICTQSRGEQEQDEQDERDENRQ